jgi:hypothetical protein
MAGPASKLCDARHRRSEYVRTAIAEESLHHASHPNERQVSGGADTRTRHQRPWRLLALCRPGGDGLPGLPLSWTA